MRTFASTASLKRPLLQKMYNILRVPESAFSGIKRASFQHYGTQKWDENQVDTTIGVARIFDWGGPNHKSHAMTSSEIFEKVIFCGAKIS